jgi:hypothetical protein
LEAGRCIIRAKPPLPLQRFQVAEGLRWPILFGRITPTQAITIDEENYTQNSTIIDAWPAKAFGKERPQPRHLRVSQPERIAHRSVSLWRLNHAKKARSMDADPNRANKI